MGDTLIANALCRLVFVDKDVPSMNKPYYLQEVRVIDPISDHVMSNAIPWPHVSSIGNRKIQGRDAVLVEHVSHILPLILGILTSLPFRLPKAGVYHDDL